MMGRGMALDVDWESQRILSGARDEEDGGQIQVGMVVGTEVKEISFVVI